MIVFVAGMPRSGSTFSFNVAREILSLRGTVYHEYSHTLTEVVARSAGADHILWKDHSTDEASMRLIELGAASVICTFRKPRTRSHHRCRCSNSAWTIGSQQCTVARDARATSP